MRIMACAHLDGALDRLSELRPVVEDEQPDMVVFAGGLIAHPGDEARSLHQALHALAALPCAFSVVPGENDAPERRQHPYASTVVVSPGRLDRGEYAVFDPAHGREVRFSNTTSPARSR
jgi:Icc-related predicted phosphoesterase